MKYEFIEQQRRYHRVEKMARVLNVSRSGYYAWRRREASCRAREDEQLTELIAEIQEHHAKYRYGSRRMTRALRARGRYVGRSRVARLMRENGLNARRRKKYRVTTMSAHKHSVADNLVDRQFRPEAPNTVWASDLTYIATAEGWLYLCVVIDLFSRRVVGWAMSRRLGTRMALQALWMAITGRGNPRSVIFHSDRGVQYASRRFRRVLRSRGFLQSMSRKGDCWDNACVESFFKTLKSELIGTTIFESRAAAERAIFEYIEAFYNRVRLHSTLGYMSPAQFEEESGRKAA